jgi:hypothetical protein
VTTYPRATYRPLERAQHQPKMVRHDIVCLHTMVGNLTSTDRMFHQNGWTGTESHFGIGGPWGDHRDGEIVQWQDTEFTADANLDGNRRIISIETGDNAPKRAADIAPWTDRQLSAIVDVTVWACKTYNIPAVLVPDSGPGRRGIAYHRLGVQHSGGTHPAGFLQPGGERWSTSVGKECPGPARIAQIPGIVAKVRAIMVGQVNVVEVPSVEWSEKHKYTEADAKALGDAKLEGTEYSVSTLLRGHGHPGLTRLRREQAAQNRAIVAQLGAQQATIAALANAITHAGSLTAVQAEEAAAAGARAALEELGKVLATQPVPVGPDETP